MARITRYSNWGGWDQLDGRTLQDGERLRLTWPNGFQETATIAVVDIGMNISDHGHSYRGQNVRAYVDFNHHGATARVPIAGFEAERVDLPADGVPMGQRFRATSAAGSHVVEDQSRAVGK